MAVLYKANETDFNHLGLGPLNDAVSILVTEERNGMFELEMSYPIGSTRFNELKLDRIIKADAGYNLKNQRFKIIRITKPIDGIVTINAEHVSYLTQDLTLKPTVNYSGNASQALATWNNSLVDSSPFIVASDITTTGSGSWSIKDVKNAREALGGVSGSILETYGGEYRFDNYSIRLMEQRGVNSGALIAYGRNLVDLTQEESISDTFTSVYPYAVYQDANNKEVLLTLPEYFIDSEYVGNYARRKILPVDFSSDEIKDVATLRTRTTSYIKSNGVGIPKVNMKIQYVDLAKTLDYKYLAILEEVNLCDNVSIYFEQLGVNTSAKIIKTVWNELLDQYKSIEVGEAKSSLSNSINTTVDGKLETIVQRVNTIQLTADGLNLIYRGPEQPPPGNIGDLWYEPDGIYENMYQWDGVIWKLMLSTRSLDAVKKEVEAAIADIDVEKKRIDQTILKADQAIADVGFIRIDVALAKVDAANALSTANTAITNAGAALSKANTAITDSSSAVTKANKAITDSGTAITNASNAISRVGAVEVTTGNLTTSYDVLSQTVGLKADKTVVDGINGKVTTQGTAITANATAIGLKADKTVVDTINGVVTKHTTDIKVVADGLLLKADSSAVNTLNGTVTTHTTQIKAASDGLLLKADSSTVNTIKGTVDTHTTQIKATSDGLALKAEKSLVDSINSTVGTHTTQIKATSDGLALKAEKSLVDTVKSTVDKHTTDIKVVADGLALKAESSLVNTINGTVNTHTNQISANSTAIGLRLTSAQVESAITAKNYVNQTTLNATSTSLTASITQVSTDLSNLQIGGRNHFTKSSIFQQLTTNTAFLPRNIETPNGFRVTGNSTATGQIRLNNVITENGWWTVSFDIKGNQSLAVGMTVDICDSGSTRVMTNATNTYTRVSVSVWVTNYSSATYNFVDFGQIAYANFWVDNIKVEKGQKATDWSPAIEDMATLEKFVTLEATVNGINTVVGTKASQTEVTQLATQVSSKVESAAYNSKMTQLDSAINLRVVQGDVTAAILADKTIKDTRATNELPSWYYANYPKRTVEEFKQRATMGVTGTAVYGQLTTQVQWDSNTGGSMTQIFNSSDGVFQRKSNVNNTWTVWEQTAEVGKLVAQINLSPKGVLIQGKNIQLDGDVTMTNAFVNQIKAIEVIADKITSGTFNGANMNIINLNASSIVTGTLNGNLINVINLNASNIVTGTLSGINGKWDLNTGIQTFTNQYTGALLKHSQAQISFEKNGIGRVINYHEEGYSIGPYPTNAPSQANTSIHFNGFKSAIQFNNREGTLKYGRLEMGEQNAFLQIPFGTSLRILNNIDDQPAPILASFFKTSNYNGWVIEMNGDTIKTPRDGDRNIYITPSGTGSVNIGDSEWRRWNINANDFVKQSSRKSKQDIKPIQSKGLDVIGRLNPVSYKKKDKVAQGIIETELGFIAEDSLEVATLDRTGIYDSHITAYLVKAVQELDVRTLNETEALKERVAELEQKIKYMESAG